VLKSFKVKNFRNLNINKLDFKPINILVGPNNSGKSNLINAISFFSDLILGDKATNQSSFLAQMNRYGWDDLLNKKADKPGKVMMKWVLNTDNAYSDLSYHLQFQVGLPDQVPKGFFITNEQLSYAKPAEGQEEPFKFFHCHDNVLGKGQFSVRDLNTNKPKKVSVDIDVNDSVFRQVSLLLDSDEFRIDFYPNFKQTVQNVQDFFERFHTYSSTEFNLDKVRDPQEIELNARFLHRDGSNFVNVLSDLYSKSDFLDDYTQYLRELIPSLEKIKIVNVTETKRQIRLTIDGETFKLKEMSDGTIKAMILTLLLWSPNKTTILALDEPELNLHPAWLKVISNWVLRSHTNGQIFISSHSPDFLDGFTEMFIEGYVGLFIADLREKQTIKSMSHKELESYFSEGWELGDLYRVGNPVLGGWPW